MSSSTDPLNRTTSFGFDGGTPHVDNRPGGRPDSARHLTCVLEARLQELDVDVSDNARRRIRDVFDQEGLDVSHEVARARNDPYPSLGPDPVRHPGHGVVMDSS